MKNSCIFATAILSKKWPVRLSVRTPGFHPGKRGSIPLRATKLVVNKFYKIIIGVSVIILLVKTKVIANVIVGGFSFLTSSL